jgi:hypothetical protein
MSTFSALPEILDATCHGALTIDNLSMNRGAWQTLNNHVLWQPANKKGSDTEVPTRAGVIANRRRKTVTEHTLEMLVAGTVDRLGVPTADPVVGLEENLAWLEANIFAEVPTISGTRMARLTLPSGAVRQGPIHVLDVAYGVEISHVMAVTVDISIPDGELGPRTAPT